MASIANDPNGRKRILFFGADGKRRALRLGEATVKEASQWCEKLAKLVNAKRLRTIPDDEVIKWLGELDATMYGRLVALSLAEPRRETIAESQRQQDDADRERAALAPFVDRYIANLSAKPSTKTNFGQGPRLARQVLR